MRQADVVAIVCSDIHLSHRAPIARSAEPDWYAAMERGLKELRELQHLYRVPVYCAGDVFDTWKSCPELINFALDKLPTMYAIPGQHDLPFHSYEEKHKSAFQTLVHAGKLMLMEPGCPHFEKDPIATKSEENTIVAMGTPWNGKIYRPGPLGKSIYLAIVHRYIWIPGHSYPNAPKESRVKSLKDELSGYTIAVFGDNHKGFQSQIGDCSVFNCGTFFRRKVDEIGYRPTVGIIKSDGTIVPHYLDTSEDKFIDIDSALAPIEKLLDMSSFLAELASLGDSGLNFVDAVRQFVTKNGVDKRIHKILEEALHGHD